jgi:hypothetical protein
VSDAVACARLKLLELRLAALPAEGAKEAAQHVLETAAGRTARAARGAARRRAAEAARADIERLKDRRRVEAGMLLARALAVAGESLEARLALGVDLAAVERLALVFLAENFVGGVQFGKTRRGLRIAFVGVRVQLLGEAAECLLDLSLVRPLGHAEYVIGVAQIQTPRVREDPVPAT